MIYKLPNLIIGGVHKAATTSLFMYLKSHPDVFGSSIKEIHYFTPLRYNDPLKSLVEYSKYFEGHTTEKYKLEASPSYMYGKELIIASMQKKLPEHKVVILLREPSSRFISFYKHLKSKLIIDESETLDNFLKRAKQYIGKPIEEGNVYSRAIQEGFYVDYIAPWIDAYGENLKVLYFEDLKFDIKSFMRDLSDWLNIDPTFYENKQMDIENKTVFAKNLFLHKIALQINDYSESFFRSNPIMKRKLRNMYYRFNEKQNLEKTDSLILEELNCIYKESNQKLGELFNKKNILTASWMYDKPIKDLAH